MAIFGKYSGPRGCFRSSQPLGRSRVLQNSSWHFLSAYAYQALWSASVYHLATSMLSTVSPVLQMEKLRLRNATLSALSHTAGICTQICLPPKPWLLTICYTASPSLSLSSFYPQSVVRSLDK